MMEERILITPKKQSLFNPTTEKPEYLIVKLNGKKQDQGIKVKFTTDSLQDFINEDIIKKHMSRGKTYPNATLFSQNGVELCTDDELMYLHTGDIVYLARNGENFDYQQVMDRYEKIKKLGEGGFGKVYLMKDKQKLNNQLYAVKVINMTEYLQKADKIYEIDREAKTLRMLNSKYIVQLENYFILNKKIVLVMEYADGGELKQYLNSRGGKLPEYEVQQFMRQIVQGLITCHFKGIIHRDLKMENILFTDQQHTHVKIVDFGIAGFCLNNLKERTDAGTFKYMAPEVLKGEVNLANPQMDIWALGIMMFIMLYGFHPFIPKHQRFKKDYDIKVLLQRIMNENLEIPQPTIQPQDDLMSDMDIGSFNEKECIPFITEECQDLISKLLTKNPKERIQLNDVQTHPWFELSKKQISEQLNKHLQLMQLQQQELEERNKQKLFQTIYKRNSMRDKKLQLLSATNGFQQQKKLSLLITNQENRKEFQDSIIDPRRKKRMSQFDYEEAKGCLTPALNKSKLKAQIVSKK